MNNTDRIEKKILLQAPQARVWRALTSAEEFGAWFQAKLEGRFAAGATIRGKMGAHDKHTIEMVVERIEPERLFTYRWHPYALDPAVDYSAEPTTLVEFRLEEAPGGTLLTVTESGFDAIPATRRAEAFRMHDGGWTEQLANIERYVAAG